MKALVRDGHLAQKGIVNGTDAVAPLPRDVAE